MNVYDRLAPLEPLLAGEWRGAGYAAIALPLAITLWALVGRRWRADGTPVGIAGGLARPGVRFTLS